MAMGSKEAVVAGLKLAEKVARVVGDPWSSKLSSRLTRKEAVELLSACEEVFGAVGGLVKPHEVARLAFLMGRY